MFLDRKGKGTKGQTMIDENSAMGDEEHGLLLPRKKEFRVGDNEQGNSAPSKPFNSANFPTPCSNP